MEYGVDTWKVHPVLLIESWKGYPWSHACNYMEVGEPRLPPGLVMAPMDTSYAYTIYYYLLLFYLILYDGLIGLWACLSNLSLSTSLDPDATHFNHGFWKLNIKSKPQYASSVTSIIPNDLPSFAISKKPLIRLQDSIPIPHILEEIDIEFGLAICIQRHPCGAIATFRTKGLQLSKESWVYCWVCISPCREVVETVLEDRTVRLPNGVCPCTNMYSEPNMHICHLIINYFFVDKSERENIYQLVLQGH